MEESSYQENNDEIEEIKPKKQSKIITVILAITAVLIFLLVTVLEFVAVEIFLGADIREIGLEFCIKNTVLILVFNMLIYVLFRRIKLSLFISELIVLIVGIANYFVLQFRGYGIVVMDFFSIKTAGNVAGAYEYSFGKNAIIGVLILVFCIVITSIYPEKKHKALSIERIIPAVICLAMSVSFIVTVNVKDVFFNDVSSLSWDHRVGMDKYGYVLYTVCNAQSAKVTAPRGYSASSIDRTLESFSKEKEEINSSERALDFQEKKPNIILIMNEAYSDQRVLGTINTNKPFFEFYDSMKENTVKGYLESSVYGGYTSISEFEFLSGLSKSNLPGNPYLQYLKDYFPNLITSLKDTGFYSKAIAIHPYNASGYNRNRVYPLLGFDIFYDKNSFEDCELTRGRFVSDEDDFNMIKKLYEEKDESDRLLIFNVTMQNHNPYTLVNDFDAEDKVKLTGNAVNETQAEEYLTCIRKSDEALKDLVSYFEKEDEPTVILMFGDHHPHLPDSFYEKVMGVNPSKFSTEDTMDTHKIPFLIWANYDIEEKNIGTSSINYLPLILKETIGAPLTDFDVYLKHLYEEFPSISSNGYFDKEGNIYRWYEDNPTIREYKEVLDEYGEVAYNYLFDENRVDEHYK